MRNDKCTVLVMARDASIRQCYLSSIFFRKYWGDCPYEYVLCTQTKAPQANLFDRVIYTREDMIWGERLDNALKEIHTEYVFLLQEDYFLKAHVDTAAFAECMAFMDEQDAGLVRLNPPVLYVAHYDGTYDIIKENSIYRICGQPSIFKKKYLEIYAAKHYSPWQFEREGSLLSREYPNPLFVTKEVMFDSVHAWSHGMWLKEAYDLMREEHIEPQLYNFAKIYPWYAVLKDEICMLIIRIAPELVTKIRIRQCKVNEKKLRT